MSCRTVLLIGIASLAIPQIADAQIPRRPTSGVFGPINPGDRWNSQTYRPWYGNIGHTANQSHLGNRVWARGWSPNVQFGFQPGQGYGVRGVSGRSGVYGITPYGVDNGPSIVAVPRSNLGSLSTNNDNFVTSKQPSARKENEKKASSNAPRPSMPSSPETIARSEKKQQAGDELLKALDYPGALGSYRAAVLIASDRAEPKFRLGFVFAAMGEFPEAVEQFKRGLELDATLPSKTPSFDELIGTVNGSEKSAIQNRAADWVKEDVRDADRLFLMGVLLHLDRNKEAAVFFDTAYKLAGEGEHLVAFLKPASDARKITSPDAPKSPANATSETAKRPSDAEPGTAEAKPAAK